MFKQNNSRLIDSLVTLQLFSPMSYTFIKSQSSHTYFSNVTLYFSNENDRNILSISFIRLKYGHTTHFRKHIANFFL